MCVNTYGSYYCDCYTGYHLISNQRYCIDTNECLTNNGNCDQYCRNTIGSYYCSCYWRYYLNTTDHHSCHGIMDHNLVFYYSFYYTNSDIDECALGTDNCWHNCYNTIGSYYCRCRSGYRLHYGYRCYDINECDSNNGGCEQRCINTGGSYYCQCNETGYALDDDMHGCSS